MSETKSRLISDMEDGETGYTTPWALYKHSTQPLWFIRTDYHVRPAAWGTATLKITKHGSLFYADHIEDGYAHGEPLASWGIARVLIR